MTDQSTKDELVVIKQLTAGNCGDLPQYAKGIGEEGQWQAGGWHLLQQQVDLPVAVLSAAALANNINWMQQYAVAAGVQLAPHGKTGMLPAIFQQQIERGAWGITLATVPQVVVAARAGIRRILLANPLVGRRAMQQVAELISQGLEFYCLVDDPVHLQQLADFFTDSGVRLQLLIEFGVEGGRGGVRDESQALLLAQQIQQCPALALCGIEFYEGVIKAQQPAPAIRAFVRRCIALLQHCQQQQLFAPGPVLLTGAGSAWYDLVAETFTVAELPSQVQLLIRPGCYVFFDTGIYLQAQQQLLARSPLAAGLGGQLHNALEVWAYVLSRPEPGLAVIGLGKRDMAFDAGLAQVSQHYRPGRDAPCPADPAWRLLKMMDQHAVMQLPVTADVAVGDMLSFTGSHPCLTLDKWRYLAVLDEDYQIRTLYPSYF